MSLLRTKIERLADKTERRLKSNHRSYDLAGLLKQLRAALDAKDPPRPTGYLRRAAEAANRYDGLGLFVALLVVGGLAGCADRRPTCYDNPRNMSCMTPEQLEKELSK